MNYVTVVLKGKDNVLNMLSFHSGKIAAL